MPLLDIALLVLAGFGSSVANAVAGGGIFLTFGALTAIGLPPITANATSAFAALPGYATSVLAYRGELRALGWNGAVLLAVSGIGGALGAVLLLEVGADGFERAVPWLLAAATALFAAGPYAEAALKKSKAQVPRAVAWGLQGLVSVYGNFFGAGGGLLMLGTLGLTEGSNFHRLNAIRVAAFVLIATIAVVLFARGGLIAWGPGSVMLASVALGGYLGVAVARRVPQVVLRPFVMVIGLALTVHYAGWLA